MTIRLFGTLLLAAAISTASLCGVTGALAQTASQQVSDLSFKVKRLQAELDTATRVLSRVTEQYKAGQISQGEVETAQGKVAATSIDLQRAQRERDAAVARQAFTRPVTIQLDHASVKQFATALSKAANVSIKIDPAVPADASTSLTLDAQGVPLGNVLEAIAEKADLMISPDDSGVILKKWPHLNERVIRGPIAPWSNDWGVPPTVVGPGVQPGGGFNPFAAGSGAANPLRQGEGQLGGFPGQPGQAPQGDNGSGFGQPGQQPQPGFPGGPGFAPGNPRFGGQPNPGGQFAPGGQPPFGPGGGQFQPGNMPGMAPMLPFTMTSLGDHLIAIAEPGMSDNGEPGIWMTAYMFDANGFRKVGRGFHPFANQPGQGPDGRGGNPNLRPGQGQPGVGPRGRGNAPQGGRSIPGGPGSAQGGSRFVPGAPAGGAPGGGNPAPGANPGGAVRREN